MSAERLPVDLAEPGTFPREGHSPRLVELRDETGAGFAPASDRAPAVTRVAAASDGRGGGRANTLGGILTLPVGPSWGGDHGHRR